VPEKPNVDYQIYFAANLKQLRSCNPKFPMSE